MIMVVRELVGHILKTSEGIMSDIDFSLLLYSAEHQICYSAKRAIEMHIPVWKECPAINLFEKCAEHYRLLP